MVTEKISRIKIGQVKYNGVSFDLFLSNLDKFNDMVANITNQSILISPRYFNLTDNEKEVFMWHEIGHLINNSTDEFSADKFAVTRTSKEKFEKAIDDAYIRGTHLLYYSREKAIFRAYGVYRINAVMETEIKPVKEKFKIELYDKFKGDKGIDEMIKISETLTEKDLGGD